MGVRGGVGCFVGGFLCACVAGLIAKGGVRETRTHGHSALAINMITLIQLSAYKHTQMQTRAAAVHTHIHNANDDDGGGDSTATQSTPLNKGSELSRLCVRK